MAIPLLEMGLGNPDDFIYSETWLKATLTGNEKRLPLAGGCLQQGNMEMFQRCFRDVLEMFCSYESETSRWSQLGYQKNHFRRPNFIQTHTLSVFRKSHETVLDLSPSKLGAVAGT